MSDANRYLESFPTWLKTLSQDVTDVSAALRDESLAEVPRRLLTGSINYLFKSLDLIPDGIEDLGFIDDAFVLRVAAALATTGNAALSEGALGRLATDAALIKEFLGADYARLESYVRGLTTGAARGRSVDDLIANKELLEGFLGEVASWVSAYEAPGFTREDKTLVKLKAFLDTKLPKLAQTTHPDRSRHR